MHVLRTAARHGVETKIPWLVKARFVAVAVEASEDNVIAESVVVVAAGALD